MEKFEKSSGNVFADLGRPDAEEMLVKAKLVQSLADQIRKNGWTQQYAADVIGLTQPKLSDILRGRFRGVSESKLLDCITKLGFNVDIVIQPASQQSDVGHLDVLMVA